MRILLPFLVTLFFDEDDLARFRGRVRSASSDQEGVFRDEKELIQFLRQSRRVGPKETADDLTTRDTMPGPDGPAA